MTGHNPTDRSKLGTKRHILTDKKGIPISVVISSASTHDIKLVTNVVDNVVIKRPPPSYKTKTGTGKRKLQHLCLDKAYISEPEEHKLIKRGYVLHIPSKRKRDEKEEEHENQDGNTTATTILFKTKKIFCKKVGCRANQLVA